MSWPDEAFLNLRQTATPTGTPANGGQLLYVKSDGKLYTKNASGVEQEVTALVAADLAAHIAATAAHGATGAVVGTTNTQTLTNKTLTAPKIDQINDTANNAKSVEVGNAASGVNYVRLIGGATGAGVSIGAGGTDGNINLNLFSKGIGVVLLNGIAAIDASSAQTLTNKDLTSTTNTFPFVAGSTSGTTDASGDLTVSHSLGVVPTAVQATYSQGSAQHVGTHTFTATTFKIRYRTSSTGAVTASTAVGATSWTAFK